MGRRPTSRRLVARKAVVLCRNKGCPLAMNITWAILFRDMRGIKDDEPDFMDICGAFGICSDRVQRLRVIAFGSVGTTILL
jgi:hypothetical protein